MNMIVPNNVKTVATCTSYEEMLQNKGFFMKSFVSIINDFYKEVQSKKSDIFLDEYQRIAISQQKYIEIF